MHLLNEIQAHNLLTSKPHSILVWLQDSPAELVLAELFFLFVDEQYPEILKKTLLQTLLSYSLKYIGDVILRNVNGWVLPFKMINWFIHYDKVVRRQTACFLEQETGVKQDVTGNIKWVWK